MWALPSTEWPKSNFTEKGWAEPRAAARAAPAPDTRLNKGVPEKQHTQPRQSQRERERETGSR